MSLYNKYRPHKLEHVLGNNDATATLKKVLSKKEPPHTYLFHGPKGNGKTTLARITCDILKVDEADLREMDTADFRGIDSVRDIRKQAQYKAMKGGRRMWILDECHQLTKDAQSALLKILEDTPQHVFFALCTTEPEKLLPTLRDRCTEFEVKPLSDGELKKLLLRVTKAEKKKLTKQAALQIMQDSLGHPRAALQILEQVLESDAKNQVEIAKRSAAQQNKSIELCQSLIKRLPWSQVRSILNGLKNENPESVRRHVLGYAQAVLLKGDNTQAGLVMELFIEPFYNSGFAGLVYACYSITQNQ